MPLHVTENAPAPDLSERLEHFVNARTNGLIRNLTVAQFGDDVVLSGTTHTYYTKQLATHAVYEALDDVVSLTNNIEVD